MYVNCNILLQTVLHLPLGEVLLSIIPLPILKLAKLGSPVILPADLTKAEEVYNATVRACAELLDPLASFTRLRNDDMHHPIERLTTGLDWLSRYVCFDTKQLSEDDEGDMCDLQIIQVSGPHAMWSNLIEYWAKCLLEDYYDVGREDDNTHPIFTMLYPPITCVEGDYLPLHILDHDFWHRFVKAVILTARRIRDDKPRVFEGWTRHGLPQNTAVNLQAQLTGLTSSLCGVYTALGRFAGGKYHVMDAAGPQLPYWEQNVWHAGKLLAEELNELDPDTDIAE